MPIVHLSDPDDERLRAYFHLTDAQLRNRLEPEAATLICESEIAIRVALCSGIYPHSLLVGQNRLEAVLELCDLAEKANPDLPIYVLPRDEIKQTTGYRMTRGVLCAMQRPKPANPAEILGDPSVRRVAVLEDLVDVSNVGAVIRSAAALGVDAVLLSPGCADPLQRRAVRVSMGTIFQVRWARLDAPWPSSAMDALHEAGFSCIAMALTDDARPLGQESKRASERRAIFLGNEASGLTSEVVAASDEVVRIPMKEGVDSLNVAAASAVAFWELCSDH